MKKRIQTEAIFHGEVVFQNVTGLISSEDAVKDGYKVSKAQNEAIVGPSETVGNSHNITLPNGAVLYEKNGQFILDTTNAAEDVKVFCPKADKHSEVSLTKGVWAIGRANTLNATTLESEKVKD
jgi:hypothetical protein